jgi:NTP pyrophosphatase (non-canonical NTP hydrolase)
MAALRNPDTGCPWDLKQDFSTIAPYTIEEAYEVADAIARGDLSELREELGDLLLQVVYHARMAQEQGAFRPIWKPCCGKPMCQIRAALCIDRARPRPARHIAEGFVAGRNGCLVERREDGRIVVIAVS